MSRARDNGSTALAPDLLPAALAPFRRRAVRGRMPLFLETAAERARPRSLAELLAEAATGVSGSRALADNLRRLERRVKERLEAVALTRSPRELVLAAGAEVAAELGLPEEERRRWSDALDELVAAIPAAGALVACTTRAPIHLLALAAERHLVHARSERADAVAGLLAAAEGLLAGVRAHDPEERRPARLESALGALGSRLFDLDALSEVATSRPAPRGLPPIVGREVRAAVEVLRRFLSAAPELTIVTGPGAGDLEVRGTRIVESEEPCRAARAALDESSEEMVAVVRAAAWIRAALAGVTEPEEVLRRLTRLDAGSLAAGERESAAPVLVVLDEAPVDELGTLSELLASGRPVEVLWTAPRPASGGLDPFFFGLAHGEVFVQQGSLARPVALWEGFERALASGRPALHRVAAAPFATVARLDPWLVLAAAVEADIEVPAHYDPQGGEDLAARLEVATARSDAAPPEALEAEPAERSQAPSTQRFVVADYALLDPAWASAFRMLAAEEEAAALPVAEWLDLPPEAAAGRIPVVLAVDEAGTTQRLTFDERLAAMCRARSAAARRLRALAGAPPAAARKVADAAAVAAEPDAVSRETLRRELREEVVDQLVAALLEVDPASLATAPRGGRAETDARRVDALAGELLDLIGPQPLDGASETPSAGPAARLAGDLLALLATDDPPEVLH